jgi:outer membrane protein OmpA-like peptidoglycan-associated protein
MKKLIIPTLIATSLAASSTYNYSYDAMNQTIPTEKSLFMYGKFEKIIRFDMLNFEDGVLSSKSNELYNEIVKTIKQYQKDSKELKISVIGHTSQTTDDLSENSIDSDTYANRIQNLFRPKLSTEESDKQSLDYANSIASKLTNDGIDQSLLVVENRGGEDRAFSQESCSSRELNNRVMVAIYLVKQPDKDSDNDGVLDGMDKCPNSPKGAIVDKNGCCLDSDGDGVYDYKDKCPNTPKGVKVNEEGCTLVKTLKVNFKTASYEILQDYMDDIVEFKEFLQTYPTYKANIIGHTDNVGKESANLVLSQKRADAIKKFLVDNGIESTRLSTEGKGELEPVSSNDTEEGRKENRRIEVTISE